MTGYVSGDAHVNEPRDLWSANLPPSLARRRPCAGIEAGDDGNWSVLFASDAVDQIVADDEARLRMNDPDHRLAVMRDDGVVGECVFPTIGLYVWMLTDPVGRRGVVPGLQRVDRRRPRPFAAVRCAGLVPTWRVEDALAEVAWIADHGLAAVMLPATAAPGVEPRRSGRRCGAVVEETGLPVVFTRAPAIRCSSTGARARVSPTCSRPSRWARARRACSRRRACWPRTVRGRRARRREEARRARPIDWVASRLATPAGAPGQEHRMASALVNDHRQARLLDPRATAARPLDVVPARRRGRRQHHRRQRRSRRPRRARP